MALPGSPLGEGPLGPGVLGPEPEEEAAAVSIDSWFRELERPTRRARTVIVDGRSQFPVQPQARDTLGWHRELDRPVRRKTVTAEEGSLFAPGRPQANDAIGWHKPLDEPQRLKRIARGIYQFETPAPFPRVPWGWYEQLDHWHPLKRVAIGQVALRFVAAAPGSAVAQNWFQALDLPTRARKLYEFPATSIPVYFVPPVAGPGNEYNWFQPIGEPVRPRVSIKAAQQQSITRPPLLVTATLEYGWYPILNTPPVRRKATTQYLGWSVANVNPVVPQGWSWVDTPRRLKRITRYDQTASYFPIAPVAVADYNWFAALDTPVRRRKPGQFEAAYGYYTPGPGPGVKYDWFEALDIPTRRIRSRAVYQRAAAYSEFTPPVFYYAATSSTAQVFQRAIFFDHEALGPVGVALPNVFQQTVTINVSVAFNRMLRYACRGEQVDPWSTQAEETDPWSTQAEDVEDWDEEDPTPESGCP